MNVADELRRGVQLAGFRSGVNRVADIVELCASNSALDRGRLMQRDGRDFQVALELVARGKMSVLGLPIVPDDNAYRMNPRGGGTTFFSFPSTAAPWSRVDEIDLRHRTGALRDLAQPLDGLPALPQFVQVAAAREAYDRGLDALVWGVSLRRTAVAVEHYVHAFSPEGGIAPEKVALILASYYRRFFESDDVGLRESRSVIRGRHPPVEISWNSDAKWVPPGSDHRLGGPRISTAKDAHFDAPPGWRVMVANGLPTSLCAPNDAGIVVTVNADIVAETFSRARSGGSTP